MREQQIYKERLNFSKAQFILIDHEDAMVATVYKVTQSDENNPQNRRTSRLNPRGLILEFQPLN